MVSSFCKSCAHSTIKPPLCVGSGSGYHFLRAFHWVIEHGCPGGVEAPGLDECPEGEDGLASFHSPSLARPFHPRPDTSALSAQPLQRRPASASTRCRLLTEAPFNPELPVQGHTVPWRESAHQKHFLLRSKLRAIAARKANLLVDRHDRGLRFRPVAWSRIFCRPGRRCHG